MLKTIPQLAGVLSATVIDDNEDINNSGRNDEKSAKSDFIKPIRRAKEPSFLTPNAR